VHSHDGMCYLGGDEVLSTTILSAHGELHLGCSGGDHGRIHSYGLTRYYGGDEVLSTTSSLRTESYTLDVAVDATYGSIATG